MLQSNARMTTSKLAQSVLVPLAVLATIGLVSLALVGGFATAVVVSVAMVVTVAALISLEFGVFALIFVAAVDGFLKGLSPGWHTQLLKDYLLALMILRWAWLSVLGHRRRSVGTAVGISLLLFVAWTTVQLLNARNASLIMSLAGYRTWVIWFPIFFIVYDYIEERAQVQRLLLFHFALFVPLALYGVVQYQIGLDHLYRLGPGFRFYQDEAYMADVEGEWTRHIRPPATAVSPHAFAESTGQVLLLGVGAIPFLRRRKTAQLLVAISMPLLAMAVLVTAVRNAAAATALGAVALLLTLRRVGLAIVLAVVVGIGAWQVDQYTRGGALQRIESIVTNPEYTRQRIMNPWKAAVDFLMDHPLGGGTASGVGRGRMLWGTVSAARLSPEHRVPWVENDYGRALVELGIPGFLLLLGVLVMTGRSLYLAYRRSRLPEDQWLIASALSLLVAISARLTVGSALYGWPGAIIFWAFVAAALRLPEIEEREREEAQSAERSLYHALNREGLHDRQ